VLGCANAANHEGVASRAQDPKGVFVDPRGQNPLSQRATNYWLGRGVLSV